MGLFDRMRRPAEPDRTWQDWAMARGFEFQQDGSELAGRYFDLPPDRPGQSEEYHDVIRGTWRGRPFLYFQRRMRGGVGPRRSNQFMDAFVLQLPGTPRADLLAVTPEEAFKAAGGELPRSGSYQWVAPDSLLGTGARFDTVRLEGILERIIMQVDAAPPGTWQ